MTTRTERIPAVSALPPDGSRWRSALVAFFTAFALALLMGAAFVFGIQQLHGGRVLPGVSVGGVALSGLDRAQAEARLREVMPPLSTGQALLTTEGTTTAVDFAALGRDYDVSAVVQEAFAVGRRGSLLDQTSALAGSLTRGTTIELGSRYDMAAVQAAASQAAAAATRDPVDASVTLTHDGAGFAVSPATAGRALDPAGIEQVLVSELGTTRAGDFTVVLDSHPVEPAVSTAAAEAAVARADAMTSSGMSVTVGERRFSFDPATLRRWVAFERTADGAYGAVLRPDELSAVAVGIATAVERPATDASAAVTPGGGGFTVSPAALGETINPAAVQAALASALGSEDATLRELTLTPDSIEPTISTLQAEAAVQQAEGMVGSGLVLRAGEEQFEVPAATLRGWVAFERSPDGVYGPRFDTAEMGEVAEAYVADITSTVRDARLTFGEGDAIVVVPAAQGRTLDVEASVTRMHDALLAAGPAVGIPTVGLAVETVEPTFTTAQAQAIAPRMERISSWKTYYSVGENNFFGANITVPTSIIDGYSLAPGEEFSFWDAVGEVSTDTGYGPGAAILGGRTRTTGALAGGICSCSTTIFNAALRAGLEMGDRRNHYYYISRYPVGLDATVFKGSNTVQDMTFRNDTANPILIRGVNSTGLVRFHIYGVRDGRTVTFSDPVITRSRPATDTVEYTDTLEPGKRKRIEYPIDGFHASVTRTVRDANGQVLHSDTFTSRYARITGVTLIGEAGSEGTDSDD
ncbi:MAG: VanW family protein [Chloroflexi bacterium]|nr:VanW family protein [Chloroflexota bacterium]